VCERVGAKNQARTVGSLRVCGSHLDWIWGIVIYVRRKRWSGRKILSDKRSDVMYGLVDGHESFWLARSDIGWLMLMIFVAV
jgi:hypothetical protein